jgi:hypothetical protein
MSALSHQFRASRVLLSASLICALSIPAFAGDGTGKSDGATSAATPPAASAANAKSASPKPDREKKIYTNEDVEALAGNYGVSTVGTSALNNPFAPGQQPIRVGQSAPAPPLPPEQNPVLYARQYASLTAQIDDIDGQVQSLRNFRASDVAPSPEPGITVGLDIYAPCDGITTDAQIEQLLQQRAELEAQISGLEDRARVNGIAPGVLYRAPEEVLNAENTSPLTPQQQLAATREALETLQSQLAEIRDTEAAMHQDAAAQHITLIPETKFGGGFTADYLKQLSIQQSEIHQQLSAVEDTARHQGIPPSALP